MLGMSLQVLIALRANSNDDAVPRLDLSRLETILSCTRLWCQDDHRHLLIDERDRAMFHLAPA
jgi:hypothetical protein